MLTVDGSLKLLTGNIEGTLSTATQNNVTTMT